MISHSPTAGRSIPSEKGGLDKKASEKKCNNWQRSSSCGGMVTMRGKCSGRVDEIASPVKLIAGFVTTVRSTVSGGLVKLFRIF